jgi:hypothetical protein
VFTKENKRNKTWAGKNIKKPWKKKKQIKQTNK